MYLLVPINYRVNGLSAYIPKHNNSAFTNTPIYLLKKLSKFNFEIIEWYIKVKVKSNLISLMSTATWEEESRLITEDSGVMNAEARQSRESTGA